MGSLSEIRFPERREPMTIRLRGPAREPMTLRLRGPARKSPRGGYQPRMSANISGATMVASDSMMNFGVSADSFPQVIFSFGTAPE